ncbi:MAG: hypothetical protein IIY56_05815 [Erysipelotrichaceae bacterium]|nr:hypothetical protein [Erysipelotrichaceae bacterium]
MAKYLACGNVLFDSIKKIDGTDIGEHMGGQAMYATSGIRVWSKSVKMVTNCGKLDFPNVYLPWLKANGLTDEGVNYEQDWTAHVCMQHTESGAYKTGRLDSGLVYDTYLQGMMELRMEQIEANIDTDTVAIYHHPHIPDTVYFSKIEKMRKKYGVRFMYELVYGSNFLPEPYFNLNKLKDAVKIAGLWSLNRNEAQILFDIPRDRDDDIIAQLQSFPEFEMCYYRCGSKGAYVVTPDQAVFVPLIDITESVDSMGCGNCSTGTAMAAWCETDGDPLMTGIMAAISAGFNAAQAGPWPVYTAEDEQLAKKLAQEYYQKLLQ